MAKQAEIDLTNVRKQLKETRKEIEALTAAGKTNSAEFKKAKADYDEFNDVLDKSKFAAGQFEDKMASLPGPLGKVGSGIKSVKDSITVFGKGLTAALGIVGLLVTAFFTMKEALGKTEEGTKALSAITSAFNKVLAPILAIFERMALAILPIVTKGLELVGNAMGKVAKLFGVSTAKIDETTASLEENNEAAKKLADKEEERAKKAKEIADKAEEQRKKNFENKLKMMEANDKLDAANLEKKKQEALALAKTEEEKLAVEKKFLDLSYNQTLKDLQDKQKLYKEDTLEYKNIQTEIVTLQANRIAQQTALEEKGQALIDKKKEEERKKNEENFKKLIDYLKKTTDDKRAAEVQALEDKITLLDAENDRLEGDFQADLGRLEKKKQLLEEEKNVQLNTKQLTKAEELKIISDFAQREREVDKEVTQTKKAELEARQNLQLQYADVVGQLGSFLQQAAGDNKALAIAGLVIEQAAGVAKIIINTQVGASKALSTGNVPLSIAIIASGVLSVAQAVLATKKGIEQIKAQQVPGAKGGSASSGAAVPAFAGVQAVQAPQLQTSGGQNPTAAIGETIVASQKPVRAYVVSGDVSSMQALDRRTNRAATFGG